MSRSRSWSRSPRNSGQPTFSFFNSSQQPTLAQPSVSGPSHSASLSTGRLEATPSALDVHHSLSADMATQMTMRGMRRLESRRQMEERNFLSSKARAQNLNPPVDLRSLDYVTAYDDNLMCAICRCPFVDPVVLTECDHCFCRDCIRQTWASTTTYTPLGPRGDCPSCRTPAKLGLRNATSKILVNIVDDLVVRCPKTESGCTACVKRGEVQDHVSIYCGYAMQECATEGCELPILRKDVERGCLHFGVSCIDCRQPMQKATLESHWRSECPDRKIDCTKCKSQILSRDLDLHSRETCPAISVACPGASIGCASRSKRSQAEVHAKSCTFAKLAPVLAAQKQRMDEQEVAQKTMSRKLEVMETGLGAMQSILYPKQVVDPEAVHAADPARIPLLLEDQQLHRTRVFGDEGTDEGMADFEFPAPPASRPTSSASGLEIASPETTARASSSLPPSRAPPPAPGPRPNDLPSPFSPDFDIPSPFPPPAAHGPYVSPLHHLLSMHESLRDEMSRISSALQELDGRHSMQTLNENLRTREEISYLGAQVAGVSRQVHWLTSAQLQRQSRSGTPAASSMVSGSASMDIAGAGAGVEAAVSAVSTAATALRGAARVVNVGQGGPAAQMRRGHSEEGRTKL